MKRKKLFFLTGFVCFIIGATYLHNRDIFHRPIPNDLPLIIAHRGASGYAPENTMAAIHKALELKSDIVEIDIHLSKDGELVVIHDATVDRTTSGSGQVNEFTLQELKQFDAGRWMGKEFSGEKIPTLNEVIQTVRGKAILLIEIKKGVEGRYEGLEEKLIRQIRDLNVESEVIIQSFQKETVEKIIQEAPDIEVHKLLIGQLPWVNLHHDGEWQFDSSFSMEEVAAVNPAFMFLTNRFMRVAREQGKKVFTYTVNEQEKMKKCMELGVDGIITNYPDRLSTLIRP